MSDKRHFRAISESDAATSIDATSNSSAMCSGTLYCRRYSHHHYQLLQQLQQQNAETDDADRNRQSATATVCLSVHKASASHTHNTS